MTLLFLILLFILLGSGGSVLFAAFFLVLPQKFRETLLPFFVSYAAGTLLGASFLAILPNALTFSGKTDIIFFWVLCGIVFFFLLEKLVLWRHCHHKDCTIHTAAGPLILIGDAFHNFVDGIVIAGSFFVSISSGIVVSIGVIAHEIPQEVGDFALLIDYGYSRKVAFFYNLLSSMSSMAGGILAFYTLTDLNQLVPYVLAVSAASFLYIAMADIMPGLHRKFSKSGSIVQIFLILAGIATIALIKKFGGD